MNQDLNATASSCKANVFGMCSPTLGLQRQAPGAIPAGQIAAEAASRRERQRKDTGQQTVKEMARKSQINEESWKERKE